MLVNCTQCNTEINRKPSQVKRAKNVFCSTECKDIWQKGKERVELQNRIKHNCDFCNNQIEVENYKYQKYINGEIKNLFCDKTCLANWQKENFKGDKSSVYDRVEKVCEYCKSVYNVVKSRESTSHFCSPECSSTSRISDHEVECDHCKNVFYKKKSQIKDHNFCSKECSTKWTSENKNIQVKKTCLICDGEFHVQNSRSDTAKTCSKKCHNIWLKEVYFKSDKGKQHLISNGIKSQENKKFSETKPERITRQYLDDNNIEYIAQNHMYEKFLVDFYLPKYDIVLEVFGDYWHGNPIFYGENESLKPLSIKQIKQKNKDKTREAYLTKCGHRFVIIWENDIYKNINEVMKVIN